MPAGFGSEGGGDLTGEECGSGEKALYLGAGRSGAKADTGDGKLVR